MDPSDVGSEVELRVEVVARPGRQDRLLFLIHGYGGPVSVLTDHLDALDPEGRFVVAAPIAPFVKSNPGNPIWHRALSGASPEPVAQFHASILALQRCYTKMLAEVGAVPSEAVIGGFSQGAGLAIGLALATGEHAVPRPAGCLAFCGFAPPIPGLRVDLARIDRLRLFLSVSTRDEFISLDASRASAATLCEVGFDLRYHELQCGHEVSDEAADLAGLWLADLVERGADAPESEGLGEQAPTDTGGFGDLVRSTWIAEP